MKGQPISLVILYTLYISFTIALPPSFFPTTSFYPFLPPPTPSYTFLPHHPFPHFPNFGAAFVVLLALLSSFFPSFNRLIFTFFPSFTRPISQYVSRRRNRRRPSMRRVGIALRTAIAAAEVGDVGIGRRGWVWGSEDAVAESSSCGD